MAQRCIDSIGAGPVLDPFMGSGTTAVATEHAALEWIGIKKSPEYIKLALRRIRHVVGRLP